MGKLIDLTDQRFGRLAVVERQGTGNTGQAQWKCLCDCGKETTVLGDNLRRGYQVSCGCYHSEIMLKHGATVGGKSSEYKIWQEMKRRCYDVNGAHYQDYGGRGIKVCERWLHNFESFYEDMGKRPSKRHSIDRMYNDGDYEPGNCRWATQSQQTINQRLRSTNKSGYKGITWEARRNSWLAKITVNYKPIHLGNFKSLEDAVEARQKAELRYHKK